MGPVGSFGTPFVVTYGYRYGEVARIAGSRVKPWLYSLLERVAIPRAAGVIVTSRELEAHVKGVHPTARVIYAPNGVDMTTFAPRPSGAVGKRSVLYVGRLSAEKNLERLVDAVGRLRPPAHLVVIGTGDRRAVLERQAVTAGVSVEFRGVVPHGELPAHFNGADLFVLPSLTEGHPKVLIEAMACGLPCAVSARGGNLTLVEDGITGLLFDPEDTAAMARALERLLTDTTLARRVGASARALVADRYDVHALLDAEVRFVEDHGARRRRSPTRAAPMFSRLMARSPCSTRIGSMSSSALVRARCLTWAPATAATSDSSSRVRRTQAVSAVEAFSRPWVYCAR